MLTNDNHCSTFQPCILLLHLVKETHLYHAAFFISILYLLRILSLSYSFLTFFLPIDHQVIAIAVPLFVLSHVRIFHFVAKEELMIFPFISNVCSHSIFSCSSSLVLLFFLMSGILRFIV